MEENAHTLGEPNFFSVFSKRNSRFLKNAFLKNWYFFVLIRKLSPIPRMDVSSIDGSGIPESGEPRQKREKVESEAKLKDIKNLVQETEVSLISFHKELVTWCDGCFRTT